MQKVLFIVLLFVLLPLTPAAAQGQDRQGAAAAASALRMTFPQMQFDEVYPTPIEGIYEVVAGDKIVYFAPRTRHLIFGEIWNAQGESLTKARQAQMMSGKIGDLPLDKALKIGDGAHTVIEVTDPDCPFCRKGSEFLDSRSDVTRYIFFNPLKMHPEAEPKSRYILSAENPVEAYEEVMSGRYDDKPLPEFEDNNLLEAHKKVVDSLGIKGTPKYWIDGTFLSGANIEAMKKLLGPAPQDKTE